METVHQGDKTNCLPHKGHEFIPTLYHFPSNCEACAKPLWHVFKPPPALECRRCHVKCHRDHLDKKEDVIAPCKGKGLIGCQNGASFKIGFHSSFFERIIIIIIILTSLGHVMSLIMVILPPVDQRRRVNQKELVFTSSQLDLFYITALSIVR